MNKQELLNNLPQEYSKLTAEEWVMSVLAVTSINDVEIENEGHDKKVNLPSIEAELFFEVIQKFGKPSISPIEGRLVGNPNIPLIFLWALGKKYRLGLRYSTEVTNTGILKYKGF